ncbi:MAG TPA: DUF378 domain-containing protein [Eubacteriales bacterium]|nr:DUF378 domain-containing protein [Clostridia bacterium]HRV72492.1 DUF378 domain-containing protein [Eubacteriales bacterium]
MNVAALILMIIGALNWGLVGLFNFNLVSAIFGNGVFTDIIYVIVCLAGLWGIGMLFMRNVRKVPKASGAE